MAKQEEFTGTIISIKYKNETYTFTIKNKEKIIAFYKSTKELKIKIGDIVKIKGKMNIPNNNTIPNTINYKEYLNNHNVYYTFNIKKLEIIDENQNIIYKIKNYVNNKIDNLPNKEYIKAFIIGDKSNFQQYETYQSNGVSHLFALSGMHITLLSGILLFILKKIKYKYYLVIFLLIIYSLIASTSPSIIRSIIFFTMLQINKKCLFNLPTIKIHLFTIIFMLIFNEKYIFDIAFIYSSIVTFGLILSSKYYRKSYFYNMIITSTIAFLFSTPISLYNNFEINLLSIINNIITVPLITCIIYPLCILTFILSHCGPILSFFIFILETVNNILNSISIFLIIPKMSLFFYAFYYILLIIFILSNNKKYLILLAILLLSAKMKTILNDSFNIHFLDVGQGDSSLITQKDKAIIIDTGYNHSDNIIKFLKSKGLTKIRTLIITHGDYDHMGDAINLVNNFKVEKVIFNCGKFNDLEKELISVLNKKKIKYYSCIKELNFDNNKLYFLNDKDYGNENDNSIVLYTEFNNYKFLFMGDASVKTEKDITDKYNLKDIDVIKVGHHGSKTSSSEVFINKINPKYSVISVGKNNRYRHPNSEVLDVLDNSKIYRTDIDGSIMFKIKNNKLDVNTCPP